MRSKKSWGILGSIAGVLGSVAACAYFSVALLATTTPALASPSSCLAEEIELALSLGDKDAATEFLAESVGAYAGCQVTTPGHCLAEEIQVALDEVEFAVAVEMVEEAEAALMMCEMSQF